MHWHVMVDEKGTGGKLETRKGALATSADSARVEAGIEEAVPGRKARIESCSKPCFAGHA